MKCSLTTGQRLTSILDNGSLGIGEHWGGERSRVSGDGGGGSGRARQEGHPNLNVGGEWPGCDTFAFIINYSIYLVQ